LVFTETNQADRPSDTSDDAQALVEELAAVSEGWFAFMASEWITSDAIDASEFPELAERYQRVRGADNGDQRNDPRRRCRPGSNAVGAAHSAPRATHAAGVAGWPCCAVE